MARNNSDEVRQAADSENTRYFRSAIAGLSVVVGDPDTEAGEVAPQVVRFTPFIEKVGGDDTRVGYLKTDDMTAIKKLSRDLNVKRISREEYQEATDVKNGARRAPF